jgi:tetratricopeptide (TPR) repeat protein
MASMPTLELPAQPVSHHDESVDAIGGKAVSTLGTWMAVLGTVRLACEIAEYSDVWRGALATGQITSGGWGSFLNANPPVHVLVNAWPLLLGLAILRTRWWELVKTGALTFLILSIGGVITAVADWSQTSSHWIAIGSFRVPRVEWAQLSAAGMATGVAGSVQLVLELVLATYAIVLAFRRRPGNDLFTDRHANVRRWWFGRLAVVCSVAFLVLTIRLPAWSAYFDLINQSRWIRELILRDDFARIRGNRRPVPPQSPWATKVRELLDEGEKAWLAGHYAASSDSYGSLAAMLDAIPTATMSAGERRLVAYALNNWAWLLATCPEKGLQNHEASVKYGRRALDLEPNDGNAWNTLGVAYFRLGDWDDALNAFYRSMELRDEGDSADWFFLAMIHSRLGHKERAREWYDKAVQWSHRMRPGDDELYRFEVEAAQALGLPKPEKLARPPTPDGWQQRYPPFGPPTVPSWRGRPFPRDGGSERWPDPRGSGPGTISRQRSAM